MPRAERAPLAERDVAERPPATTRPDGSPRRPPPAAPRPAGWAADDRPAPAMRRKAAGAGAPGARPVKKRKAITLEQKLDVIGRYERHERTCDIMKATGFAEGTLRTIRANAEKIKEHCTAATPASACRSARTRPRRIERMERLLSAWIEAQTAGEAGTVLLGLNQSIRRKALAIYEDLKANYPDEEAPPFSASSGWFAGFKNRYLYNWRNAGTPGGPAGGGAAAGGGIVEEGGYSPKQVFNLDDAGLFWKRLPARTYLSREEASAPGFRAARDRVTVMLGANVHGDCKLKPVVAYHAANPPALNGLVKHHLPVHFRPSKRGRVTGSIFSEYFSGPLHDELRLYCRRENIAFKILLVLDRAPGHPSCVAELSENVKVIFLPPDTASLLQPMDQGVFTVFRVYYLRRMLGELMEATAGEGRPSVREFWKGFNIKNAIDLLALAWTDVAPACLNGGWRNLLPQMVVDFRGLDGQLVLLRRLRAQCVTLAKEVGFDEVEAGDVEELLESHGEELSAEELLQLLAEVKAEGADEEDVDEAPFRELTQAVLSDSLQQIEEALCTLEEHDRNVERSGRIVREVKSLLTPYTELLKEKNKAAKKRRLTGTVFS
ncbi:tigger transposable element-derived protein 1-like [Ornithorhynchus anatinus]|uniref:tigger transposable element-derived protein 1-like n=1 Tax=Ornithorhynchus anatinus TaxID=9258 RepID=UPI0010A8216B|nr:tigger transposable element-derived protein 1-like [Ornithorhynchus anatinus]